MVPFSRFLVSQCHDGADYVVIGSLERLQDLSTEACVIMSSVSFLLVLVPSSFSSSSYWATITDSVPLRGEPRHSLRLELVAQVLDLGLPEDDVGV